MPLLTAEPSVFPPNLLESEEPPAPSDAPDFRWWALHTRPRTEKELARRLLNRSVSFFLPLRHKEWLTRGRRFSSHLPLFPGYLFLYGGERDRVTALETNLIVNCLSAADQSQLHDDLHRVYRLVSSDVPLTLEEKLGPGDPVVITQGRFTGLQGRVLRRWKNLKFTVEIHFLQQGVSIEVEPWMIEPLEEGASHKTRN
ncbi:MAG TPA: transcription termination/antitermination NusG family protein [Gemmataceae bacterium]|nr:transcription termination/antitermination NusG family protein [Gemmataceae bacterium]